MAGIKKRKIGRWIVLSIILILAGVAVSGNFNLFRVRRETHNLREQINRLNMLADSLGNEIDRLASDTAYIEKLAREKLGMAKKGEVLYKFAGEKQARQQP